ncbi:MAG: radical SAM family heme chaperone HemW [Myxococcales bacterium]|nr:radical SAM family heme chaperone HemW [Myxococcales bacterium]MBL0193974.1 radical SAM family heme chaperone HemW [Myxococcales bacterium]HQY62036.1 radical SAM family heme chaperone HemW [Polyangiaceae bacterium]
MGSVYVHFPYCLAKCPYCDFTSYASPRDRIDHAGYADAVLAELRGRARSLAGRARELRVATVFFGGGTPSLWEPAELGRVLEGVRATFSCAPELEVTVECNPTSLDAARAQALRDVGVGRLSIGSQSLDAEELRFLGRLHDPAGALAAVRAALGVSGLRVSTDLIFGLPGQAPETAAAQATALADLGLQHVSAYQLTIEAGTRFGELAKVGRLPLADDGRVAEAFLAVDEALVARGFEHYEISNFARPGERARHNEGYWRGDEYLGLGCGAVGALERDDGRAATRYRNPVSPADYMLRATAFGDAPTTGLDGEGLSLEVESLPPETRLKERIMLGLRLAEGFDLDAAAAEVGAEGFTPERERAIARSVARGRLMREGTRLSIPRAAWLFTDDTAARLF